MPYTPNTTWVDGSGGGTPVNAARLNNVETGIAWTWDTYVPVWTSAGTAPALGNGTLAGKYIQRGKFVTGDIRFIAGSTSTFGTGAYSFSLPVTSVTAAFFALGSAFIYDSSADSLWTAVTFHASTTTVKINITGAAGAYATGGAAAPFVWAVSDQIMVAFTYEAA